MGGRRIVGCAAAATLVAGLVAPAVGPANAADSVGSGDSAAQARGTARAAEGLMTPTVAGVKSRRLMGKSAGITPKLRAKTRNALRASKIKAGKRPSGKMPREPYIPQNACYAYELPGVQAFRDMLLDTFPRSRASLGFYNIGRGCNTPGVSEHEEGRALDFEANTNNPLQYAQARRLLKYLTKRNGYHAKRWGIMYIIFDKQIWAQYKPWWRRMSDRGNRTDNHQDHIHFSFTWNGAVKRSAYWTGQVRRPDRGPCVRYQWHFAPVRIQKMLAKPRTKGCKRPRPFDRSWDYTSSIMYWQSDARVKWLQQFLTEEGVYEAEVNGNFGQITFGAVRAWQVQHRLPPTGVWDPVTQNRSGRVVGKRSKTTSTGWPGRQTMMVQVGQTVDLPVTVTADGAVGRSIEVQRRPADRSGPWTTVVDGTTAGSGGYGVQLRAEEGSWLYRLVVAESSRYEATMSRALTLTTDAPVVPLPPVTTEPTVPPPAEPTVPPPAEPTVPPGEPDVPPAPPEGPLPPGITDSEPVEPQE